MVGALLGSRRTRVISTTMTKQRLTDQARLDVVEGRQTMDSLRQQISDLQAQSQRAAEAITSRWSAMLDDVREVKVMPRNTELAARQGARACPPVWELKEPDWPAQTRRAR